MSDPFLLWCPVKAYNTDGSPFTYNPTPGARILVREFLNDCWNGLITEKEQIEVIKFRKRKGCLSSNRKIDETLMGMEVLSLLCVFNGLSCLF